MGLSGYAESKLLFEAGIITEDYYGDTPIHEVPPSVEIDDRAVAMNKFLAEAALKNTRVPAGESFPLKIPQKLRGTTIIDFRMASSALNYFDLDRPLPSDIKEDVVTFQAIAPQHLYGPFIEDLRSVANSTKTEAI